MIPDFQTLMLPVLKQAENGEITTREAIENLSIEFNLSDEDREELLPSGKQRKFDNRVNWSKSYLKQAGLVRYTKRGSYIATDLGKKILQDAPEHININFLKQFEQFQEFQTRKNSDKSPELDATDGQEVGEITPDEALRVAHRKIMSAIASDLLDNVREASPQFFENLIIELLLAMGYGGTSEDAGRALGKSGDNGVDGVIDQDPLGVDQIYVQAKRYAEGNTVGSPDIRNFSGALDERNTTKGLFFTTSKFTPEAIKAAEKSSRNIVLIDGLKLAKLMLQYNIGCRDEEVLHLKKIDDDYFSN